MNITQMDAWPTDYERAVKEVERLRAEVKDLRARLKVVRHIGESSWFSTSPRQRDRFFSATDLRRKNWRQP